MAINDKTLDNEIETRSSKWYGYEFIFRSMIRLSITRLKLQGLNGCRGAWNTINDKTLDNEIETNTANTFRGQCLTINDKTLDNEIETVTMVSVSGIAYPPDQ